MENTKKALSSIPLLKTKAGPRDVDLWPQRLKEEYQSLIQVSAIDILVTFDIYLLIKHLFFCFFFFNISSMFKIIKQLIMIGFV